MEIEANLSEVLNLSVCLSYTPLGAIINDSIYEFYLEIKAIFMKKKRNFRLYFLCLLACQRLF